MCPVTWSKFHWGIGESLVVGGTASGGRWQWKDASTYQRPRWSSTKVDGPLVHRYRAHTALSLLHFPS